MLNRVALDREKEFADVVLDFVPDVDTSWPDLIILAGSSVQPRERGPYTSPGRMIVACTSPAPGRVAIA